MCVNDIALVSTKLIASVSDDNTIALVIICMYIKSNYETGELLGMKIDTCEIKCVVGIDGSLLGIQFLKYQQLEILRVLSKFITFKILKLFINCRFIIHS